jgi:hypothetical protein
MADLAGYPYCDAHGLVVAAISADAPYAACTKCRKWIDLCDCGHALPLAEACRRATDRQVAL